MFPFNVRVYGILINNQNEVLISDERVGSVSFTKFPGGGLEYGEGLLDALKREYLEECNFEIDVIQHLYTTDFYEKSSFNDSQIISIYYLVKPRHDFILENLKQIEKLNSLTSSNENEEKEQSFRLIASDVMTEETLTFKTDKIAWKEYVKTSKTL